MIALDRPVPLWELKAELFAKASKQTEPAVRAREERLARLMTEDKHPYFSYLERVPEDEKKVYRSLDDHPNGGGIAFEHWMLSGAFERCARDDESDEKIHEIRTGVEMMTREEIERLDAAH